MDVKELSQKIKTGKLGGCYVFAGEEDYLKKYYLGQLKSAAGGDEAFAAFNHIVYDGEIDFASLTDAIKAPPMFEEYKLIEWKYPDLDGMKESELSALEDTLTLLDEYDYAVLAILVSEEGLDVGTPKKPGKFVKRFKDRINILSFPKSTDTQLLSWLKKHFDAEGIACDLKSLEMLLFRSGHSMTVLSYEVEKLCAYLKANGRDVLTVSDVSEVASATLECDQYAFSNALLERNKQKAFLALQEMKSDRTDPILILGMLSRTYSDLVSVTLMLKDGYDAKAIENATKMHPAKLKHYLSAARIYSFDRAARILKELSRVDASMKYGGITGYAAIELFLSKCL